MSLLRRKYEKVTAEIGYGYLHKNQIKQVRSVKQRAWFYSNLCIFTTFLSHICVLWFLMPSKEAIK